MPTDNSKFKIQNSKGVLTDIGMYGSKVFNTIEKAVFIDIEVKKQVSRLNYVNHHLQLLLFRKG